MAWRNLPQSFVQRAGQVPGLRTLREGWLERRFCRWPGAFRGVFDNFEQAAASIPKEGKVGYDHPEFGSLYDDRLFRVMPADYPVLYWLGRLQHDAMRVFDFGGHIGLAYYGFERYLGFSPATRWTVYDLPKVVEAGRQFSSRHPREQLRFTTARADISGHDVFHASGALQYVEAPLHRQLAQLSASPAHLLLNKVPLTEGPAFSTLQNTLHAYNPYAIFNRADFLSGLSKLGYEVVDEWTTPGVQCSLLDRPDRDVPAYSGFYMRRLDG